MFTFAKSWWRKANVYHCVGLLKRRQCLPLPRAGEEVPVGKKCFMSGKILNSFSVQCLNKMPPNIKLVELQIKTEEWPV